MAGNRAIGCEVTWVHLYVADSESAAQNTEDTTLSVCGPGTAYWFRVEWCAYEYGSWPPDYYDHPFYVQVWEGSTKIWGPNTIADEDPGPQDLVDDITTASALTAGKHKIKAMVRRKGSGPWRPSNECTVTLEACTEGGTDGREYAWAQKAISNLIAVKGKIKTRYGKLCCECSGATTYTSTSAFVAANADEDHWAQVGYKRFRDAVSPVTIITEYYREIGRRPNPTLYTYVRPGPSEGTDMPYECELDNSTGTWTYKVGGYEWTPGLTDSWWVGRTAAVAIWEGEIRHKENDMPGTEAPDPVNPCVFQDLGYKQVDDLLYNDAGISSSNLHSTDWSEWYAQYLSPTSFKIWDKDPIKCD